MKLRKPCEHGKYDGHPVEIGPFTYPDCHGGEFLPEDVLAIEKIEAERIIARAIARYHMTVGDAVDAAGVIVDALAADQVGEPGT